MTLKKFVIFRGSDAQRGCHWTKILFDDIHDESENDKHDERLTRRK